MVIASIDLQDGKAVQLKQGKEFVLARENTLELAEEFDFYGETAVIDLDAAMGKGNNTALIKQLLRKAECRVGGGIKTTEKAKELVSFGAKKVIVGSAAFRKNNEFCVNLEFLAELEKKIGKERIILAIDAANSPAKASNYEITIDGWKTKTGLDLLESARIADKYVSEFLFTCIDREGTMKGIDLTPVKLLRDSVSSKITAAGGVNTHEEIEIIGQLGCDVQLGMALYTGKINLAGAFIDSLNWEKAFAYNKVHLLPVIAQSVDGQVLMTGFTDKEALAETFKRKNLCFHSRSRNKLWMKGESSGNILKVIRLRADCDRDAILAIVDPGGPVCHTGSWSCFENDRRYTMEYLQEIIKERFKNPVPGSYTASLDDELVREKVLEEAEELCKAKTQEETVWEAADLFYFATALITRSGIDLKEVLNELDLRHKK